MKPNLKKLISKDWTIFLDRDGVINIEQKDDYVRNWEMFQFSKNALNSFSLFSIFFNRIIVVTNQRGVEKKLMTIETLNDIHYKMNKSIQEFDGKIDKIYFCTSLSDEDLNRKPNPGMAFQAKSDFPEINLSKSIMVGNSSSDMQFGRNCGMYTVFVTNNEPKPVNDELVDFYVPDLYGFAKVLQEWFPN
jgi:histidinol-phosphate phosphatase family protein